MTFAALKDMARIVQEYKSDQPEVLGNVSTTLLEDAHRLYQILLEKKPASDEECVNAFFQHREVDHKYYQVVKNKLKKLLTNSLFFIDQSKVNNLRIATYINSHYHFAVGETLFHLGGQVSSAELFEEILEVAREYNFVRLSADILLLLKLHYFGPQGNAKKGLQFILLLKEFEEKRNMEVLARIYLDEITQYYAAGKIPNQILSQKAHNYYEELNEKKTINSTVFFKSMTYTIGLIKFMASSQYMEALNLCEIALKEVIGDKNINRGPIALLLAQKMYCLIHLKIYDTSIARDTMKSYWKYVQKNSYNAFKGHELEIFYALHSRQYSQALQHYEKGRNHPLYPNIKGMLYESWQLYGGYLHLLAELGQLDKKAVEKIVGPFRYSKFINDIKIMSREKEGMNIPLVNLPILFSLAKGDGNFPEEYMATLERYRKRYLHSDMNIRSASFVKLLLLLARKPFEGKNVDRKIEKELAVLRQQQPQFSRQTIAIEIIPYEDLWWLLTGTPV